jgi:hypothetical protein
MAFLVALLFVCAIWAVGASLLIARDLEKRDSSQVRLPAKVDDPEAPASVQQDYPGGDGTCRSSLLPLRGATQRRLGVGAHSRSRNADMTRKWGFAEA